MKSLLYFAGVVEIAVGLLHFGMPTFYRRAPGFQTLSSKEDAFVVLVTFAVGILLMAFGAVTLSIARSSNVMPLPLLRSYLVIKAGLWTARVVLEVIYPVQLSMFGIDPFTMIVLPGLLLECAVFVVAAGLAFKRQS